MTYLIIIITISIIVSDAIIIYNLFTAPRLKRLKLISSKKPKVSILIPARNEEANIAGCLSHALNQTYPVYEVIVLDDRSDDNTLSIINSFQNNKLKAIEGEDLPRGWNGKNWACWQLAQKATGELLLFIDADVKITPETLETAVAEFELKKVQMLSCFSTMTMETWGERMIVSLANWFLLSFIPLRKVYESTSLSFIAANGQFSMFDKKTYFKVGGHESVRKTVAEDVALAYHFKKNGYKVITLLGDELVKCRMYDGFWSSYKGLVKNFYLGFSFHPAIFLFVISYLLFAFVTPFLFAFFYIAFLIPIILILVGRAIVSFISRQSIWQNLALHPIQIFLMWCIGLASFKSTFTNKIEWKGRSISIDDREEYLKF